MGKIAHVGSNGSSSFTVKALLEISVFVTVAQSDSMRRLNLKRNAIWSESMRNCLISETTDKPALGGWGHKACNVSTRDTQVERRIEGHRPLLFDIEGAEDLILIQDVLEENTFLVTYSCTAITISDLTVGEPLLHLPDKSWWFWSRMYIYSSLNKAEEDISLLGH